MWPTGVVELFDRESVHSLCCLDFLLSRSLQLWLEVFGRCCPGLSEAFLAGTFGLGSVELGLEIVPCYRDRVPRPGLASLICSASILQIDGTEI